MAAYIQQVNPYLQVAGVTNDAISSLANMYAQLAQNRYQRGRDVFTDQMAQQQLGLEGQRVGDARTYQQGMLANEVSRQGLERSAQDITARQVRAEAENRARMAAVAESEARLKQDLFNREKERQQKYTEAMEALAESERQKASGGLGGIWRSVMGSLGLGSAQAEPPPPPAYHRTLAAAYEPSLVGALLANRLYSHAPYNDLYDQGGNLIRKGTGIDPRVYGYMGQMAGNPTYDEDAMLKQYMMWEMLNRRGGGVGAGTNIPTNYGGLGGGGAMGGGPTSRVMVLPSGKKVLVSD